MVYVRCVVMKVEMAVVEEWSLVVVEVEVDLEVDVDVEVWLVVWRFGVGDPYVLQQAVGVQGWIVLVHVMVAWVVVLREVDQML